MLAVLAVGGTVVATNHKDVTLDVNGEEIETTAWFGDVRGLLEDNDIDVSDSDLVTPGLDESVENNSTVSVRSARQVAVTVDGQLQDIDTTSLTVSELLSELGYDDSNAALSAGASSAIPEEGMELDITTPRDFTLNDGNPGEEPARLNMAATTVGEMLEKRGTPLGPDDTVTPSADTPLEEGTHVEVHRVTTDERVEEREIDAPEKVTEDPEMEEGEEKVVEEGAPGKERVTVRVTEVNGEETDRETIDREELEPAKERVVIRGTKKSSDAPSVSDGSVWDRLVQCEATGDWSANTGNGFSGGLQFTPSTWAAFGGTEYAPAAHQASREEQIAVAEKVQAAQGWGAWPACTSKLGIG
ncbi:MAG TPA: transglycosylase family protein [Candidatus Corynebacterium avicola]|uniref:Transglycosylase family protein n=1 Tax=Candidatus Corynebacterium avicola TaxID=2838527 RepID=A0A9D1UKM4_9CORY|nr:transglycosylase family protein [Candidatus Corynebacterium avicola]